MVKWTPFLPFFEKWGPQKVFELIGTDHSMRKRTFIDVLRAILEHSGPLSGEIMTQTKKRKAIETTRDYKS